VARILVQHLIRVYHDLKHISYVVQTRTVRMGFVTKSCGGAHQYDLLVRAHTHTEK